MKRWTAILMTGLALTSLAAAEPGANIKTPAPPEAKFAALARKLERSGRNFDQIFAELCRTALANAEADPKLRLDDQVRAIFGGLWLWTRTGGNPVLQGRTDLALHFIGGGAFEGYWDAGRSAAVIKERIDARDPHNVFDLDDMAATLLGARWMEIAVRGEYEQTRAWLELWAAGRCTLSKCLPRLRYGRMPTGKEAAAEAIGAIRDEIQAALTPPAYP
jgi:hypothetical protein